MSAPVTPPMQPCPCKRTVCPRHGDCEACLRHHHLPGKKLLAACERLAAKKKRNS